MLTNPHKMLMKIRHRDIGLYMKEIMIQERDEMQRYVVPWKMKQ